MKIYKYFRLIVLVMAFFAAAACTASYLRDTETLRLNYIYINPEVDISAFKEGRALTEKLKKDSDFSLQKIAVLSIKKFKQYLKAEAGYQFLDNPGSLRSWTNLLITNQDQEKNFLYLYPDAASLKTVCQCAMYLNFKLEKISENFGFGAARLVLNLRFVIFSQDGSEKKIWKLKEKSDAKITFAKKKYLPPRQVEKAMLETISRALEKISRKIN